MTPKDDLSADEPRPARPTFDVPPRIAEGTVIYLEQVVLPGLSIPLHEFEDGNGKIHRVDVPILQHIDHIFRRLNAKRAAAGLWPLDRGQLWFVLLNEFGPAAKTNTTDYWAYTWPKNLLDQWTQSWIGPPDDPVNSPPVDPPDDPVTRRRSCCPRATRLTRRSENRRQCRSGSLACISGPSGLMNGPTICCTRKDFPKRTPEPVSIRWRRRSTPRGTRTRGPHISEPGRWVIAP